MKKYISLFILFFFIYNCYCQNIQWAKQIGGKGDDAMLSMSTDNWGNIYYTGIINNIVDFDPGEKVYNLTPNGNQDVFVSKLDANGNFVWAKSFGCPKGTFGSLSIKVNALGNIVICGDFIDSISFNTKEGEKKLFASAHNSDHGGFILKLDSNGNIDWARPVIGQTIQHMCATIDDFGNIYYASQFRDTIDFDPSDSVYILYPNNKYVGNVFVLKFNEAGKFCWAKKLGGGRGIQIEIDNKNNVITTGIMTVKTDDFDPNSGVYNLTSHGVYSDIFISKLDSLGNFVFAKIIGGLGTDWVFGLKLDKLGNICLNGTFDQTADFDPGIGEFNLTTTNLADRKLSFIAKYSENGAFFWAKKFDKKVALHELNLDIENNIYLVGSTNDSADIDPNESITMFDSKGGFITKLNSYGQFIWAKKFICDSTIYYGHIAVEKQGGIYLGINFMGTLNVDTISNNYVFSNLADSFDMVIYKIEGCTPLSNVGKIIGPQVVCIGTKATYSLQSLNEETTYTWNTPIGTSIISGQYTKTIEVIFGDSSGNVSVSQKNICSSLPPLIHSIQVRSLQAPIVGTQIIPSSTVCSKTAVKINGTGAKFYTISDSINEGIQFRIDNTKLFTIIGTDSNGCFNSDTFTIIAKPLPILSASVYPSTNICKQTPIIISGNGATNYTWNNGIVNGISFIPTQTKYTLKGTDSLTNCSDTFTQKITYKPLPIISILSTPFHTICKGDSIMLKANGALRYLWNNGIKDGLYFIPNTNKKYKVTATDSSNCSDTSSIEIKLKSLPIFDIIAKPSTSICKGDSIQLTGKGAKYYNWDNGVLNDISFFPIYSKNYTLIGTDSNGCSNSKTVNVIVNELPKIVTQPVSQYLKIGNDAHLSIKSSELIKSYQWQQHLNDSFINIINNEIYTGTTSEKLIIKQFNFNQHNFKFRCIISNGICNSISEDALIGIDSSKIKNSISENGFVVYPNPVSDILTIEGDNSIIGLTYFITDISGKLILSSKINNQITKVITEKFSQGIYIVFLNNKFFKTYKILKI